MPLFCRNARVKWDALLLNQRPPGYERVTEERICQKELYIDFRYGVSAIYGIAAGEQ